jgi:hypothetical protein
MAGTKPGHDERESFFSRLGRALEILLAFPARLSGRLPLPIGWLYTSQESNVPLAASDHLK